MDGRASLHRNRNRTWQVARGCSTDRGPTGSQDGRRMLGSRDVFAVLEVRKTQELNELVMDHIQGVFGVKETSTHIALDE